MGNINGRFSDQDSYLLSTVLVTAGNNQSALNAVIIDNDQIKATSVVFQQQGLTGSVANPVPNASVVGLDTIGAALGGIGQPGGGGGGGGGVCFIGNTYIDAPGGNKFIAYIEVGDRVWSFDPHTGERVIARVIGKWVHLVDEYTLIEFDSGKATGVVDIHRYWTGNGEYEQIKNIEVVHRYIDEWTTRKVKSRQKVVGETLVYNITVEGFHNYFANSDAVSNVKPQE